MIYDATITRSVTVSIDAIRTLYMSSAYYFEGIIKGEHHCSPLIISEMSGHHCTNIGMNVKP